MMDRKEREAAIRARMEEQIDAVAKAICEGKDPIPVEIKLQALTKQLAKEDGQ
jgi:hypothetical protein